ncbi:DJ-1/PfpI/YhbO family deglycase/protease [Ktedonospora formicarum]|nr:DJ-1/PfpI/YhbO family deglycase/protease [Ktedonospora formicarum]
MTQLNQPKRIAILVEDAFEDSELLIPYNALKQARADVKVLGSRGNVQYAGKQGKFSITSDASTAEVIPGFFDAILIPGGMAPDIMRTNMRTVHLVQDAMRQGKLIAAVCHGPQVLIEGNLLRGRYATGLRAIRKDMQNAGANYIDAPIAESGNLLTARRPGDLPILTTAILKRLDLQVQGLDLPDIHNFEAPWWKLAEFWGGSSKAQITEAITHTLQEEQRAAEVCGYHAPKVDDEAIRALYQRLTTDASNHVRLLTQRLSDLGEIKPELVGDGAQQAQQAWQTLHDPLDVLLGVLDKLQERIGNVYQRSITLTDPVTVAILDRMEVSLVKSEQQLVNCLQQILLGATVQSERTQGTHQRQVP